MRMSRFAAVLAFGLGSVGVGFTALAGNGVLSLPYVEAARLAPPISDTFFVAPNGDDGNAGTRVRPWRTIQHAVDQAQPGTTLYVRAGVYDEEVTLTVGGTAGKPIVLSGFPGERPVIDPRFRRQHGIVVRAGYVTVRGFEIRNCKEERERRGELAGLAVYGPSAEHVVLERNLIHHIIGGRKSAHGIFTRAADHLTVQNNTVMEIVGHTESMGMQIHRSKDVVIRRNLLCFCDKEGLRLVEQPAGSDDLIEGNIAVHNHMGLDVNNCQLSKRTVLRNNFSGWNWGEGTNPKHTHNVLVTHNTFVGNEEWGVDFHGDGGKPLGDNFNAVVENNILSRNACSWLLRADQLFDERVDYNLYDRLPGTVMGFFDWYSGSILNQCRGLEELRERTHAALTVDRTYEAHGKEGDPRFVNLAKGDFRLKRGSPAKGAASDGQDMGALATELVEVGADRAYSLAHIPDLGRLKLTVEAFTSETPAGRAGNAVDGVRRTYWEVDTAADAQREIVLALPGSAAYDLTFLTLTKLGQGAASQYYYREFALLVDDGSGVWKRVPDAPEHPFVGFGATLDNGESWALPSGTRARRVKLHLVSGYGPIIRLSEIRIHGRRG